MSPPVFGRIFRKNGSSVPAAGVQRGALVMLMELIPRVRDVSCFSGSRRAVALTSPPGSVPCCSVCPVTVKKERSRRCKMSFLKNRIPSKRPESDTQN